MDADGAAHQTSETPARRLSQQAYAGIILPRSASRRSPKMPTWPQTSGATARPIAASVPAPGTIGSARSTIFFSARQRTGGLRDATSRFSAEEHDQPTSSAGGAGGLRPSVVTSCIRRAGAGR